jgi:hypothetical protein
MLVEATGRFAAAVQARNHLALHVHHLTPGVDPEASARVVHQRRGPGSVKRWRLDPILGAVLAEIHIRTSVYKGIRVVP